MADFAFHELPRRKFPFTVKAYRTDNDECVWVRTVQAPRRLSGFNVPPLAKRHGVPVYVVVEYGDGTVERVEP